MRFEFNDENQILIKPKISAFKAYDYLILINFGFTLLLLISLSPFIQGQNVDHDLEDLNSDQKMNLDVNDNPLLHYHCSPWLSSQLFKKFEKKVLNYSNIEICSNLTRFESNSTKSWTSHTSAFFQQLNTSSHLNVSTIQNLAKSQFLSNSCNQSISIIDYRYNLEEYENIFKNFNKNKCLLSINKSVNTICDLDPLQRLELFKVSHLHYCNNYPLVSLFNPQAWLILNSNNSPLCVNILNELIKLDSLAQNIFLQFDQLLSRYNCKSYSVKGTCSQCKIAYRNWVCSMLLPFYLDGIYIKPCRSFCQRVEQKCPYLHPASTYAGEPVFFCIDPMIPYSKNATNVPYEKDGKCYHRCHLLDNDESFEWDNDQECIDHQQILSNILRNDSLENETSVTNQTQLNSNLIDNLNDSLYTTYIDEKIDTNYQNMATEAQLENNHLLMDSNDDDGSEDEGDSDTISTTSSTSSFYSSTTSKPILSHLSSTSSFKNTQTYVLNSSSSSLISLKAFLIQLVTTFVIIIRLRI